MQGNQNIYQVTALLVDILTNDIILGMDFPEETNAQLDIKMKTIDFHSDTNHN